MPAPITLVWFRRDLRLADNPALRAGLARGRVVPVFVWAPEEEGHWLPGAASRWWLHHSLVALDASLRERGSRLTVRHGPTAEALQALIVETGATSVVWNRLYEPAAAARDRDVEESLRKAEIGVETFNSHLIREPWDVATKQGKAYQVFTPFWRACCALEPPSESLPKPQRIPGPAKWPRSTAIGDLKLLPDLDWDAGFYGRWPPGEEGAHKRFRQFLRSAIEEYDTGRDLPAEAGTSSLSPHLHFGEISPRQLWDAVIAKFGPPHPERKGSAASPMTFLKELGWRDFAHHVLHHFPSTPDHPLRPAFEEMPLSHERKHLRAWQRGLTGYPIVDAGMRELWTTGWMHNRVRMIVGSFLTKDLLHGWLDGAKWFWDTLVDADLANNTLNWQWVFGCGADAAPYFRIFNPVSQGRKFDPEGTYVRRWAPELKRLSDCWIHEPWSASAGELERAGIVLGKDYPLPIIDHAEARRAALAAFKTIRKRT